MGSSRLVFVVALSLMVIIAGLLVAGSSLANVLGGNSIESDRESRVVVDQPPPTHARPLTLLETWAVVQTEASRWRPDSELVQLASTDDPVSGDRGLGLDGKRRSWMAVAQASGASMQLWMTVTDGVVINAVEQPGLHAGAVLRQPKIDSPVAVATALDALPDLGPDRGKSVGVHFTVGASAASMAPVIRVVGAAAGFPAFVDIDGISGRSVDFQRQVYGKEGGVLYSADGGSTWRASSLSAHMVTSIAVHPKLKESAFAAVASVLGIAVYRTDDSGETWIGEGVLPKAAGTWPYSMESLEMGQRVALLVGTPEGLWVSWDEGASWEQDQEIPVGPAWQIASRASGQDAQVFVSVVPDPQNAKLYSSTDLVHWIVEGVGVFRLSESADGASILAIDESSPGQALVVRAYDRSLLQFPASAGSDTAAGQQPVLRAAGLFDADSPRIAQSAGLMRFSADGSSWRTTLEATLASVVAAPDFQSSGIAVAGGFRSGIFRTSNHGRTWTTVLDDPGSIVPGSGIVPAVIFLSPTRVLAIHGGNLEWQRP